MLPKIKILDWDDVPEKYKYRAQDADGSFFYYDGEPELDEKTFFAGNCNWIIGVENVPNPDWKYTLEQRPVPDPIVDAEVVFKVRENTLVGRIKKAEIGHFYISSIDSVIYSPIQDFQWKYLKDIEL